MNVYDFDGTIYRGDSSVDFYIYSVVRFPWIFLLLPKQLFYIFANKLGLCSKEQTKSAFFSFMKWVPSDLNYLELFWNNHIHKIEKWYLLQRRDDDVVISASPEFLLAPICNRIGIKHLIASKVNRGTGKFEGANCHGYEKCVRFKECFPLMQIDDFYTDSLTDLPMMKISRTSYLVKRGVINEYKK